VSGFDLIVAESWIRSRVRSELDAIGLDDVPVEPAPYDGDAPAVSFLLLSASDRGRPMNGESAFSDTLYQVVFLAQGRSLGAYRAVEGAEAIHRALNLVQGENEFGSIYWSSRERTVRLRDLHGGRDVIMLGGIYRIQARGGTGLVQSNEFSLAFDLSFTA
jgi:hypothetical protein